MPLILLCLENVANSDSPTNSRNAAVASLGEHDENKKLSYLTCLLTTTPQARLVTLKIRPVLPWYTLCGIPLWMAPFTLTIRKKLISSSRCTQKTTLNNFSHGCISRQMYMTMEKHISLRSYTCIILPMAALA